MRKKLILITFFLSTSFLSAGFKDGKNYGSINFVKDISVPALFTVASTVYATVDILNRHCHCQEKNRCEEFVPFIVYLKCSLPMISGAYTLYNMWQFKRKTH